MGFSALFKAVFFLALAEAHASNRVACLDSWKLISGKIPTANEFFESSLPVQSRQFFALKELRNQGSCSTRLCQILDDKLKHFPAPVDSESRIFSAKIAALSPNQRTQSALEYLLKSFQHHEWDLELRREVIQALAESPLSDGRTVELLLPISRQVRGIDIPEAKKAAAAIAKIAQKNAVPENGKLQWSFPPRTMNDPATTRELLRYGKIVKVERFSQGVNHTFMIYFENGRKGIFKPRLGETSYWFERTTNPRVVNYRGEVTSQPIIEETLGNAASRKGQKSRIRLPEIEEVVLYHQGIGTEGGVGSLQIFEEGYVSLEELMKKQPELWKLLSRTQAWNETAARIRTIDFLIGNHDRFPNDVYTQGALGNIMLKIDEKILRSQPSSPDAFGVLLIDNMHGRPNHVGFGIQNAPIRDHIPEDLKKVIVTFDEPRFRQQYQDLLPPEGLDDFVNRVRQMQNRIENGP